MTNNFNVGDKIYFKGEQISGLPPFEEGEILEIVKKETPFVSTYYSIKNENKYRVLVDGEINNFEKVN